MSMVQFIIIVLLFDQQKKKREGVIEEAGEDGENSRSTREKNG